MPAQTKKASEQPKRRGRGEGGLFKHPRSRFWYCKWYDTAGRPHVESTKTDVKQEAIKTLNRLRGDTDRGYLSVSDLKKVTYGKMRDALLESYRMAEHKSLRTLDDGTETINPLPALDKFFGFDPNEKNKQGPSLAEITRDTCRDFIAHEQGRGVGNAAINNSLSLLRRMISLAKEEHQLPYVPPIKLLKAPPARQGFVPEENFKKLFSHLPEHLRPLILFLYRCGGRLGEAKKLRWKQVDLANAVISFYPDQTKTKDARTVPLPDALVTMLKRLKPKQGGGELTIFETTNLRKEWAAACVKAELGKYLPVKDKTYSQKYKGLTIHDLRRSALNNLRKMGVPQVVAMKFSGHKTVSTFLRYNIVDLDEMRNALQKVEGQVATPQKALPAKQSRRPLTVGRG